MHDLPSGVLTTPDDIPSMTQQVPVPRTPTASAVASGVATFALVLVLRTQGVIVGPVAVVLALACLILLPGPSRLSHRFLMFFALGFGWLPLLGWIPGFGSSFDFPGTLLAIGTGIVCGLYVYQRRNRARYGHRLLASEMTSLAIGSAGVMWWGLPLSHMELTGRLRFLFVGWDNSTHFDMFRENLLLGSFIGVRRHTPAGGLRLAWDYPQGVYQAWAQLVRIWTPHPPSNNVWLLNAYCVVLLLTLGAVVVLGCMNVARLSRREWWLALPAMAIVAQIFLLGRLWIFNGYPNFAVAVVATAVAISAAWRPTMSPALSFFVIAGLALVAAYTWYPLFILAAPAVAAAALRLLNTSTARGRTLSKVMFGLTIGALAAPVLLFAHRGIDTLSTSSAGGLVAIWTPGTPWTLVIASVTALGGLAVARQATRPDPRANVLLASPAILGGVGLLLVSVLDISSSNKITYYGQKFATGLFAICAIVLAAALTSLLGDSKVYRQLPKVAIGVIAVLALIALLEIDGYVGPLARATGASPATGLSFHGLLATSGRHSRSAEQLLRAAEFAKSQEANGANGSRGKWLYFDPDARWYCSEGDEWFSVLRGEPTVSEYAQSFQLECGFGEGVTTAATYVIAKLGDPTMTRDHLLVTRALANAIIARDHGWKAPGALYVVSANATPRNAGAN